MSNPQQSALTTLTIATRQSPLALWQAEHIRARLLEMYPELTIQLLKIVTKGDKILDTPLPKLAEKVYLSKSLNKLCMINRQTLPCIH